MLVSVVVITYNSARFVLETLESIAAQTYPEVELIITDDCSKDDTVTICRDWLMRHRERFVHTELLTVEKNTGIAGNCNRGYAATRSEWIKVIAGDDILLPQCIEKGMAFAREKDCRIFTVSLQEFGKGNDIKYPPSQWENATAAEQLRFSLTKGIYLAPPGMFCQKSLWREVGGFDLRYPMIEDLPFLLKVLDHGVKIFASRDVLVKYRIYENSVSQSDRYFRSYWQWAKEWLIPMQFRKRYFLWGWHSMVLLWKNQHPHRSSVGRGLLLLLCILIDPILCLSFFRIIGNKR